MHTPVTPFTRERAIDLDLYEKLIEFHIANGADALALPMHAGKSVSLPDGERRSLLEFALKRVNGRKPVIAHVSETGTGIAAALARHAEEAGAAAIVATTPYYWTPPPAMVLEHFVEVGSAVRIPFFLYNAPEEMQGAKVNAELCLKLIERLPNFAGVVDLSLDWQFMIELMTDAPRIAPGFQLLAGTELMVSAGAIGASGMFAPLAGIAPKLVRKLYELCRDQKLFEARAAQEADGGAAPGGEGWRRCKPQGRDARHGARLRRAAAAAPAARRRRLPEARRRARRHCGSARGAAGLVSLTRPSPRHRGPASAP